MRLGQLSKQVETKPQNIVDFVKKIFDVEIKNHPNVKIQDEWENDIVAEFAKAVEVKEATEEVAKPIKVEAKESKPEAFAFPLPKSLTLRLDKENSENWLASPPTWKVNEFCEKVTVPAFPPGGVVSPV